MDAIVNQIRVNCTKGSNMGSGVRSASNQTGKTSALNPYSNFPEGSAGHQSILDSHANSGVNALIYIGVVLLLYIIFMSFIVVRYVLMKSYCKTQNPSTPYYFGGGGGRQFRNVVSIAFLELRSHFDTFD